MTAHRNRSRTALAVAALAALSLTLTACNDGGSGTKDEGAASSGNTSTATAGSDKGSDSGSTGGSTSGSSASGSSTSGGTGSTTSGAKQSTDKGSTGGTGGTAAKAPECKTGYLDYTLKRENPEQQGDHLLITAENRSATACTVQKFPVITPGAANGDIPVAKDNEQPAQPLLVQPGGKVYSAIAVVQDVKASDDYFKSIRLSLLMNNPDDSVTVKLATPGEVEYDPNIDDGIEVYSWNTQRPYAN
ncbi:DUF4232 domain-containing protein [Streptomyces sp. NPDC046821]|uniref:DUF4232 domain-containing protein n=1 Tax=Streptomyces sp. NPDC046821 TaxID=3154702 RepID=UPI0033FA0A72